MPTQLLNDDGTASIATFVMCSHHAFRRDLACMAAAAASPAVAEEWKRFRESLHGHHVVEDTAMFPGLRAAHAELATALDQLEAHHRAIDPLLERGDRLFAELADTRALVADLSGLLDEHLELEEHTVIPHLRGAKDFPAPPSEDMLALYADGFAWSSGGIAEHVLAQVFALLPPALRDRIPAARVAFDERCRRVWGRVHTGASTMSVPDHA